MKYFILILISTLYGFGFNYHLEPVKISDQVNCFFGFYSEAEEKNGGRVVNTCFIESNEGYVVIDSGPTYSYAQQVFEVMQKRKVLPVKYVINTSSDESKILGNQFYKEQGASLIGPESYQQLIEKKKTPQLLTKLSINTSANTRLIPLDTYVDKNQTIQLGSLIIEIKKLETKKSKNLLVYLPKQETIFAGDFILNSQVPILEEHYSLNEWIENIQVIKAMSWKHIVSSHGVKRTRLALKNTEAYLLEIKERVVNSIKEHKSKKEILASLEIDSFKQLTFYKDFHTANIEKSYDELKSITKIKPEIKLVDTIKEQQSKEKEELLTLSKKIEKAYTESVTIINPVPTTKKVLAHQKKQTHKEKTKKTIVSLSKEIEDILLNDKPSNTKKHSVNKKILEKKPIKKKKSSTNNQHKKIALTMIQSTKNKIATPDIKYVNFSNAKKSALEKHKYILIKIEADGCKPCDHLNAILANNNSIKKLINDYTEAVKINTSHDSSIPIDATYRGTPTLFLIKPNENNKIVMQLEGKIDEKELEESLKMLLNNPKVALTFSK